MNIRLDYGRDGLATELPNANIAGVLETQPSRPLLDPAGYAEWCVHAPTAGPPLGDIAWKCRTACIVVCDITRPVPNAVLLPPILKRLAERDLPPERTMILIATGTHRPNTAEEIDRILGPTIARSGIRIVNHDCDDPNEHRAIGTDIDGVPVRLNRHYVDADLRITVGLIEPHFMAGWSGGRKLVMPGIAARETIHAWHSPAFLEHPNARAGVVDGNPVHEENTRIARHCPPQFILDAVLDRERRILTIVGGEMEAAWKEGVAFAARKLRATLPEPVDIVVTTGAGFPLDQTFYQAVKGMVGALPIVKPGGDIIIAAECAEGIGGPEFTRLLRETDDLGALMASMLEPDWVVVPDQWQVEELARAVRNNTVRLVSRLAPEIARDLFVVPEPTVAAAVAAALAKHGPSARIAVIPSGPYVLAELAPDG